MNNFVLATAGHIDHGKSALVKALTGTDPDRLPEEKARGITIDLGFAELNLVGPNREQFHVGIIDVPGHEDFIRNMIAGVGSIDLAVLVVAANEGWKPQTEEHLQILSYLGLKRLIIAVTKCDLGNGQNFADQIRKNLRDTDFADAGIFATSIVTANGLEELKSALARNLATLPPARDIGKARLFVDRAFILRGIGTVVTGTLLDGTLRAGETVYVQPRNVSARVRSLQTHGREVEVAQPGTRTAINLPDLQIGNNVERGDIITNQLFEPVSTLNVFLTRSSRLQRATPIKSGTSAYVHHGTTRVLARMVLPEIESIGTGQTAAAQLKLKEPLLAFVGDRLIVRDASEQHTIAGGLVIDVDCHEMPSAKDRGILASRAAAPADVDLAVWSEIALGRFLEPARLLERSRFGALEIAGALERLAKHGEIFLDDHVAVKTRFWLELRERAAAFVDTMHKEHPERRGLELSELRAKLNSIPVVVFDTLVADLCRSGFVRAGSAISRGSHRANLPAGLQAAAEQIRAALATKPFDPPGRKDLAKDRHQQQALKFLIEQGDLIEVSEEIVLIRDSFDQMRTIVSEFVSANGPATASQLREKIGTSRRVIIPFLEHLDRCGVTKRKGDLRQLREPQSSAVAPS